MSIDCWQTWTTEMSSGNGPIAYKITFRHPIFCLIIRNVSCKQTRGNPCILSQSTIALALERGNWAIAKYDPHFACYEGRKTYEIANLALKVQFGRKKCCWNTVSESMLLKLQNGLFDSKGLMTKSNDAYCDTWRSLSTRSQNAFSCPHLTDWHSDIHFYWINS